MQRVALFILALFFAASEVMSCSCPPFDARRMLQSGNISFSGVLISLDTVWAYEQRVRSRGLTFWKSKNVVELSGFERAKLVVDTSYYSGFQLPDTISVLWPIGGDCSLSFLPPEVVRQTGLPELNRYLIFARETTAFLPKLGPGVVENKAGLKLMTSNYFLRHHCYGTLRYTDKRKREIINAVQSIRTMQPEKSYFRVPLKL